MWQERGAELSSLTYEDLKPLHEAFEEDVVEDTTTILACHVAPQSTVTHHTTS